MSELVEKVAKAMYEADVEGCPWWETTAHRKERYRRKARASIKVVTEWLKEKNYKSDHVPDWHTVTQLLAQLEAKP